MQNFNSFFFVVFIVLDSSLVIRHEFTIHAEMSNELQFLLAILTISLDILCLHVAVVVGVVEAHLLVDLADEILHLNGFVLVMFVFLCK